MIVIPRSAWAPPSAEPYVPPSMRERIVVHHSASPKSEWGSLEECLKFMHQLRKMRPELFRGREPDVPYNWVFFIGEQGAGDLLVEGVGHDRRGAHAKRANTPSLGLCVAGDFRESEYPSFLGGILHSAIRYLDLLLGRSLPLVAHRDMPRAATACPGDALYKAVQELAAGREAE